MNNGTGNYHRHIHYLDHRIQQWLLIALVTMEVLLVAISMWVLYGTLSNVIDQELYHVHFSGHSSVFTPLLNEGMKILGVVLLVNLVVLVLADRIWAYRVNNILRGLMTLMNASRQLDFSEKGHVHCNHPVLVHAMTWRYTEFFRIEGFRHDIQTLPSSLPETEKEREEIAVMLKKITTALPAA